MPRLISIPQIVGSYLLEAAKKQEPSLERMVPVHHYDSEHIWVWMAVAEKGYVHGPVKIKHADVKKNKKKLAAPDGSFLMVGKIDPYAYQSGEVYALNWVPGSTEKPGDKKYASFTKGKGLPDEKEQAHDVSSIQGWVPDDASAEPDEYGWVHGTYNGVDAFLSPSYDHILDFETNKVLWPDHLKPKVKYSLPGALDPTGFLDVNGFVVYHAHDPEGLALSLLPDGVLATLNNNEYLPHKRDYDGEMIPSGAPPVPASQVVSKIPAQKDPAPKPKAKPAPKVVAAEPLPQSKPAPVAQVAPKKTPDTVEPVVSPGELGWSKKQNENGLFTNKKFPKLFKAPDGSYFLFKKTLNDGKTIYTRVDLIKGQSADKKASWALTGLPYFGSDLKAKYMPEPSDEEETLPDPTKKSAEEMQGWIPMNYKDAYGFPMFKWKNNMEYSKLPGGWALYMGGTGKYHFYKPTAKGGMQQDKLTPPVSPEGAGSEVAAAKQDRVFQTSHGELKNGFFSTPELANSPNTHGAIKVHHSNPASEDDFDWYQMPNGTIAHYNSMFGKYYIAAGSGDNWKPSNLALPPEALASMQKAAQEEPSALLSKDPHGFVVFSAKDVVGKDVVISKLPFGILGSHTGTGAFDRYQLVKVVDDVVQYEAEGALLPTITWWGAKQLKRKQPLVGNWRVAGVDPWGALLLSRGKSKPGTVRLMPTGQLAKFVSGKYKQAKYEEKTGKINLIKHGMVWPGAIVKKDAKNTSHGTYDYTGPGAVVDSSVAGTVVEPETPKSNIPEGWKVHDEWDKFPGDSQGFSVKKGDYLLKPVEWVPGNVSNATSAYMSKNYNIYVTPSGDLVMPSGVEDNFFVVQPAGTTKIAASPEEKWAHELGIVVAKPAKEEPVSSQEASPWNPPSGFEVTSKWGKGFKAKLVKKHDFDITPIVWNGPGAAKLTSASGSGTLFLTPSGEVITPKAFEDGEVFWVWSHEKGDWGPPKTAAQLGIVKKKTPPVSTGTTAGGTWNPPEDWVIHDQWNKTDDSTALDPDHYDVNPVNYVGDNPTYWSFFRNLSSPLNTYVNKTGTLFYTALAPGGVGIEFKKIEWSNGMATGYPKTTASTLGILKPGVSGNTSSSIPVSPPSSSSGFSPLTITAPGLDLPDVSELQFDSDGKGMKGAGKKSIYKDAKGNRFLFKPALPKSGSGIEPFRAYAQEVSSVLALAVREDHIPVKAVELEGTLGTLQPLLELGDPSDLSNYPPSKLTDQEKFDVAHEHIIDWIGSQHDSHKANLVRAKDGRILSIDKEQGFKYWGKDELSTDYHPNAQYGESEPYYNTFWKAFASGKLDFDPQSLAATFDVIQEDMDWSAVEGSLRKYAREKYPNSTFKQEQFLAQVRSRKNTAKRDFELFITEQYRKRTGEDGDFTFAHGWAEKDAVVYKEIKTDVASWVNKPNKAQVSLPVSGDETVNFKLYSYSHEGVSDDSLLTLKIANSYESGMDKLQKVLSALNVEAVSSNQGSSYTMVVVRKKDLEKAGTHTLNVKQEASNKLVPHGGKAEYLPKVDLFSEAVSNFNEATSLTKSKNLGLTGKYIFLDTDVVEGQTATIRRYRRDGEEYTAVHFKVRSPYVNAIEGVAAKYRALQGGYGKESDAIDQTGGEDLLSEEAFIKARSFSSGQDIVYGFPKNERAFALKGQIILELKGVVSSFKSRSRPLLEGLMPTVPADKILTEVQEKDRRTLKTWRLLNALDPMKHDALLASGKTTEKDALRVLKDLGHDRLVSDVQEVEVVSGYVGHVLPDRWKEAKNSKGEPLLKFLSHSTNKVAVAPSVLRNGFMGHLGRVYQGSPVKGSVVDRDFRTGGADTMQCRVCTEATLDMPTSHGNIRGSIQFIFSPDAADRLDAIFYHDDTFGSMGGHHHISRKPLADRVASLKPVHHVSAANEEMVFPRGLHSNKLLRVVCDSEPLRLQVIEECIQSGVTEHKGVPIEDFVVIEPIQRGVYEKYVKPAGY